MSTNFILVCLGCEHVLEFIIIIEFIGTNTFINGINNHHITITVIETKFEKK